MQTPQVVRHRPQRAPHHAPQSGSPSTAEATAPPAASGGRSFGRLELRPDVLRAVHELGWTQPTPIQEQVIPLLREGRDLVGQAQTGSGKTGAFGIPLVERIDPQARDLQALVLVPTRELALQVSDEVRALGRYRHLRVVTLFGGQPIERQFADLRRHPQAAIATPGRLLDHLRRRTVTLGAVGLVVLDEADRMLDMGFLPDVTQILRALPAHRQTALFSATMPAAVRTIADRQMRHPVAVQVAAPAPTVETVEQFYVEVAEEDKVRALRRLLQDEAIRSALVFRRTQHRADRLATQLGRHHRVGVLHGGMRQSARLRALRDFEERRTPILVATNVAARGLDLPEISHVINFDAPEDVETYIHRVGRTARAGRAGTAITLIGQHDLQIFDQLRRTLGPSFRRHPLNLYT
ncbi:MAG: DEAD/DEAH box helicase [Armatimonadota bacterium]|nr:DEAD/DEAH box helicase [Armatimonadota bacterium]MDR7467540.1 DEAD/DEAH box helicase [Armatimonadota bacterium]MDR7494499.1 DEAD/DEAH box helicase [Armatimonadota bacterium]MDR7499760.1 DEAD/DEAH box helicase [Armatimonadota bacterium]MDR7504955.1 DEAD/DEAH box helicase [Armatimonadota bacterium]